MYFGWVIRRIDLHGNGDPTTNLGATISGPRRVADGINNPLVLEWGRSGSRMVALDDYTLQVYFADTRDIRKMGMYYTELREAMGNYVVYIACIVV